MPTFIQKLATLARAIRSGRDKKLQAARDAVCEACDKFEVKAHRTLSGKLKITGHCQVCGCGARSMADIYKGKHAWRDMFCPQWKWPGDAEGKGISLHGANTLFNMRDSLQESAALLQHYADKGLTPTGRAAFTLDAHAIDPRQGGAAALSIEGVVERLEFYLQVVQLYIDAARPLDGGLIVECRGPNYAAAAEKLKAEQTAAQDKAQAEAQAKTTARQAAARQPAAGGNGHAPAGNPPLRKITTCSEARRSRQQKRERARDRNRKQLTGG